VAASIEKLKVDYRREGSGNYPGLVLSRHSSLSTIGYLPYKALLRIVGSLSYGTLLRRSIAKARDVGGHSELKAQVRHL
jgi:hypothetical protein